MFKENKIAAKGTGMIIIDQNAEETLLYDVLESHIDAHVQRCLLLQLSTIAQEAKDIFSQCLNSLENFFKNTKALDHHQE